MKFFRAIALILFIILSGGFLFAGAKIRAEDKYPKNESQSPTCSAAEASQSTELGRKAQSLLRDTLKADNGSGVAASVVVDGKLVWSGAAGHADRRHNTPMSAASRLRIGSVSKPVTAALAARLADAGLLDIDAPIQSYVPDFPGSSAPITIRMLASHLSGIRHYDFANFDESNNRRQFENLNDALTLLGDAPFAVAPGEGEHYSSFGYNLIGAAIENVTQQSFGDALGTYLTEPLELSSLTTDNPQTFTPCRARFYTVYFGKLIQNTVWRNHSESYPSAGILISAEDLAKFAARAFENEEFSETAKSLFITPGVTKSGELIDYSFGWHIDRNSDGEVVSYSHGGFTNGAYAELRYYPAHKTAIAAIANYNLWLTDKQPAFDTLAMEQLPALFGVSE